MKQLTASKKRKLLSLLKKFRKKYLLGKYSDLDESATRLMVNEFLGKVLGFTELEDIKTEQNIKGTFADYLIQIKNKSFFIIEVKAMPTDLADKHLRQAVGYASTQGIDWALLTNGKRFDFYKIFFEKPIREQKVFSIDLSNENDIKKAVDFFQYLTKKIIIHKGLENLWSRVSALEPVNFSRLLYAKRIVNHLRRKLKKMYKNRFSESEITCAITRVIEEQIEDVKPCRERKRRRRKSRPALPLHQDTTTGAAVGTTSLNN